MQYGCIGEKLSHSFSKEIHEKIADYEYELKELKREEVGGFISGKDYKALNVTIPYKEVVIPYLDEIDEAAKLIGAVNTIVNKNGKLYGYNTDFYGMCGLIKYAGIEIEGKKVLILGTGGTSKTAFAVSEYLKATEIYKVSRNKNDGAISYDEAISCHSDAKIIINTTPAGMYPDTENAPIDIECFPNLSGVVDAIYNPLRSKLVSNALSKGIKATGGLYMLVAQAVKASEYFLNTTYPYDTTERIYKEIISEKENIVLTGMPGAGKTTIGKILAELTGKEFADSDDAIRKLGKTPAELINENGEPYFRNIESQVIKNLSDKTGMVIATGGGAILKEENVSRLKRNGKIVFINRDLQYINPTSDRPLSADRKALEKRFSERYPIYMKTCDKAVKTESDARKNAENILEILRG